MKNRFGLATYLSVFASLFASVLLSGCGEGGLETSVIPTPAVFDGRDFKASLAKNPYRTQPSGYESTEAFELRAQVDPPRADRNDLKMLPRSDEGFAFAPYLVIRGTLGAEGAFRLKPEAVPVATPTSELAPLESGELSAGFLAELKRRGSLPLPVLADNRQVLRAKHISIRDADGRDRDASDLLERTALVPVMRHGDILARKSAKERVIVVFETIAMGGAAEAPVRRWLEGKRPAEAATLTHPGQNPHLKETVDQALALYREKFGAEAISMLDFARRFRLIDCKMAALATLQASSAFAGGMNYKAFVVSGNRVERPEKIDLVASNHAWNGAIDGTKSETLVFADFTPETRRPLEYVYDGSTSRWVVTKLRTATHRDEFTAAGGKSVFPVTVESVPARLDDSKAVDTELSRLAVLQVEALLPSTEWIWEDKPQVSFFPERSALLVRKHRTSDARVTVTIDPVFHWGRRGEALYAGTDRAGVWGLSTDSLPLRRPLGLNWDGTTTFGAFSARVTNVDKSSSSHSREYYWRVEVLFSAQR